MLHFDSISGPCIIVKLIISQETVDLGEGLKPPGYYVRRTSGLFPAPLPQNSEICDKATRYFWFLGVFLAKVLQDNRLVDLPLSQSFLKLMCHGEIQNTVNERIGFAGTKKCSDDDIMTSSLISEESEKELELDPPKVIIVMIIIVGFYEYYLGN